MKSILPTDVNTQCLLILVMMGLAIVMPLLLSAQDCDCEPVIEVDVCFLARNDYCVGENAFSFNCGLTFDHPNFIGGIVPKLNNVSNFGPNGTVECGINIISMTDVTSKQQIYDSGCEVFYVGHYPDAQNFEVTSLSNQTLLAIYEWSLDCSRNLAIVPQVEATAWGYTIENRNVNPNQMVPGANPIFALFDGPFGTVEDFNQGGSYQGVITEVPETGHLVLAQDATGAPTIAFDLESSDLIIGDIGYFASNQQGSISEGSTVDNNNDRFACNVFALACTLVEEFLFDNRTLRLCRGDTHILPNGEMTEQPGSYLDTIVATNGCDTIVNTILFFDFFEDYDTLILFDQLSGDLTLDLEIDPSDVSAIQWLPNDGLSCDDCLSPRVDPDFSIEDYQAVVTNAQGCTYTIFVKVDYLYPPFIPNILSPNALGKDQYFVIGLSESLYQYGVEIQDFAIYDRWGNLIRSLSQQTLVEDMPLWDGKFNGSDVEAGVYIYTFQLNYPNGESYHFLGDVTLVR